MIKSIFKKSLVLECSLLLLVCFCNAAPVSSVSSTNRDSYVDQIAKDSTFITLLSLREPKINRKAHADAFVISVHKSDIRIFDSISKKQHILPIREGYIIKNIRGNGVIPLMPWQALVVNIEIDTQPNSDDEYDNSIKAYFDSKMQLTVWFPWIPEDTNKMVVDFMQEIQQWERKDEDENGHLPGEWIYEIDLSSREGSYASVYGKPLK